MSMNRRELQAAVSVPFQRSGTVSMPIIDWVNELTQNQGWCTEESARALLDAAEKELFVTVRDQTVEAHFDVFSVDLPAKFDPAIGPPPIRLEPEPDGWMAEIAAIYQSFGGSPMSVFEFMTVCSSSLEYCSPLDAMRLVRAGVTSGLLVEDTRGFLHPTFEPMHVELPFGFDPEIRF